MTKSKVIHRGTLTIEKLKELCLEHLDIKSDSDQWNPHLHPNTISLKRNEDGSWEGHMIKNNKNIQSREVAPEHALQRLLTHE